MADNMFSDLSRVIDQVGKDKGIDKKVIVEAITQGMLMAARKKFGTYREIEASYNEATGEVELLEFKEVVERDKFIDEEVEIPLDEALKLDPEAQLEDSIGIRIESGDLGRIAAQTAKQIILQKVRDAEREIIFNEFEQRKGEIASGIARRVEKGAIVVDMGRTEAYIPPREQIPGEIYKPGDRIQGFLLEVRQTTRGPQIIMSRASEQYLMKLFEIEVPEIYDGVVEIMSAAREPGQRAKIAVRSKDSAIDPVGACVGMKGSRVQNIVQELRGEKIDIVAWNEDITRFACNALAPAEISRIFVDETNKEMEVVVPDSQLSLAIGRKGQNVRLAAKLTTWKLDIISESSAASRTAESVFNLMLIPGMNETMAQNIFQSGFGSFQVLAEASEEDVMSIPGYGEAEKAQKLIGDAKALLEKYRKEGLPIPAAPTASKESKNPSSSKEQAELRLQQELQKLEDSSSNEESQ
ncbi:MAG: transcription termination/antitermination protein NusA [Bdellovibrionaceae bacterium]|nr:transcription termination/antitermination protein NusA [Pseudobdellovibrionaceae bacterium]